MKDIKNMPDRELLEYQTVLLEILCNKVICPNGEHYMVDGERVPAWKDKYLWRKRNDSK